MGNCFPNQFIQRPTIKSLLREGDNRAEELSTPAVRGMASLRNQRGNPWAQSEMDAKAMIAREQMIDDRWK